MEIAYADALRTIEGRPCPRRTVVPPNRLETTNADLMLALGRSLVGTDPLEELRSRLRELTGRQHVFFAPSCRSAIARVLHLLPQQEVVLPAYTCPVVKTAVEVAGKRPVFVDVDRASLNATSAEWLPEMTRGRVLLPTHLYGIPTDVEHICVLARERGCVTVEDAAAAFGARHDGRPLATVADIGIVSFERSKRLPAFRGAAIVVNDEGLVDSSLLESRPFVPTTKAFPARELLFAALFNAATVPWLYGRFTVQRLLERHRRPAAPHGDGPRRDPTATPFYRRDFHQLQAALVLRALDRWDSIKEHVAQLVATYRHTLDGTPVQTFTAPGCDDGAMLRFPVVFPSRERGEVLREALRRGLFLETNYTRPLPPKDQREKFPNAAWAARQVILLPLYRRLSIRDAERIARQVVEIATS